VGDAAVVLLRRWPARPELLQKGAVHVRDSQHAGTGVEDHSWTANVKGFSVAFLLEVEGRGELDGVGA